jgi:two-component system nitrate/nitrite response regulator NarL
MHDTSQKIIRILVVDDHTLFRELLARDLERQSGFEVIGTCDSVRAALAIVSSMPVDIVLLDIDLGHEQGSDFLTAAREIGFAGSVVVVTAGVYSAEATRLIKNGASAIFKKSDPLAELLEMIADVAAGRAKPQQLETVTPLEPERPLHRPLSVRERQVLRLIFDGRANKEIASNLDITESLVKEVIQRLFYKTGVRSRGQLVRVAVEKYWDEVTIAQDESDPGETE